MIAQLIRRELENPSSLEAIRRAAVAPEQIPTWGGAILVLTFLVIFVFVYLAHYSLQEVVPTLAMVETPSAAITVSAAQTEQGSKEDKESLLETSTTITLVHQKPITSSIRGTLRHLVSISGQWARVRGLMVFWMNSIATNLVAFALSLLLPRFPGSLVVVAALAGAATANLHAAWTHKLISMPAESHGSFRIPPRSEWKVLAPAATVAAAMPYVSLYIMKGFASILGLSRSQPEVTNAAQAIWLIASSVLLFVIALACTLFICLPAMVTQIRVEASILPEELDTIVPFDRTFGGKVVSKMLGGTGSIGFLDAWKSFNWEARVRLIKAFLKAWFIMSGIVIAFLTVMTLEVFAIHAAT